jgi:REP element-mobilizing transposase RayT
MPQSLANVLLHVVFSTKGREPVLANTLRPELEAYLAGILRRLNCPAVQVGGMPEHVHFLCRLSRTLAIAKMVEEVKKGSSKWVKTKAAALTPRGDAGRNFHWQNGYGAFSVSPSRAPEAIEYIADQEKHHRRVTFEEEYRALLEKHGLAFDERYVWD